MAQWVAQRGRPPEFDSLGEQEIGLLRIWPSGVKTHSISKWPVGSYAGEHGRCRRVIRGRSTEQHETFFVVFFAKKGHHKMSVAETSNFTGTLMHCREGRHTRTLCRDTMECLDTWTHRKGSFWTHRQDTWEHQDASQIYTDYTDYTGVPSPSQEPR